jgi:hypothetical protein
MNLKPALRQRLRRVGLRDPRMRRCGNGLGLGRLSAPAATRERIRRGEAMRATAKKS